MVGRQAFHRIEGRGEGNVTHMRTMDFQYPLPSRGTLQDNGTRRGAKKRGLRKYGRRNDLP